jgi:hypothetical protein
VEHNLLFLEVIIGFLRGHLSKSVRRLIFFCSSSIVLDLFFVDNNSIRVVLDGLIVATEHSLGISFAEVVFDHVIVGVLQGLADVLETRFELIQFVVDVRYEIVYQTVFFV